MDGLELDNDLGLFGNYITFHRPTNIVFRTDSFLEHSNFSVPLLNFRAHAHENVSVLDFP